MPQVGVLSSVAHQDDETGGKLLDNKHEGLWYFRVLCRLKKDAGFDWLHLYAWQEDGVAQEFWGN